MDTDQMPALIPTLAQRVAELTEQRDELVDALQDLLDSWDCQMMAFEEMEVATAARAALSKLKD